MKLLFKSLSPLLAVPWFCSACMTAHISSPDAQTVVQDTASSTLGVSVNHSSDTVPTPELNEEDKSAIASLSSLFDKTSQADETEIKPVSDDETAQNDTIEMTDVSSQTETVSDNNSTPNAPSVTVQDSALSLSSVRDASIHGAVIASAHGIIPPRIFPGGLPKNARQVKEGYWIGSVPHVQNIDALYAKRIRLIITATRKTDEMLAANKRMEELGIEHIVIPFGGKFPKPSRFYKSALKFSPASTYIHCDHGGDRTGAMLAYMLVVRHHWTVTHALLSVLFPGETDLNGLKNILKKRGYSITDSDINEYLGIYSASKNGGGGGLKVRSDDYKKLINTMIDAIEN